MVRCKDCEYCKMPYRADAKYAGINHDYGRGEFYCKNPETDKLPLEAFGYKPPGFIGFGTSEKDTKLQVKSSPRWCPKRRKSDE